MSIKPAILLVNVDNNEKHHLNSMESVIGRGWLNCDDKRVSRYHGILKVTSPDSIAVHSTHQNLMFFRKKNDAELSRIEQNKGVNLFIGDSFGLLVDEYWFSVQPLENTNGTIAGLNGNAVQQNEDEPTTSGPKRKTSLDSEPDSTNKRVKTEPMEYQENDTTFDDLNTTIDYQLSNGTPSTSASSSAVNIGQNDANTNQPIKIEPSNSNEVQSVPTVRIKAEPKSQEAYVDSTITPVPIQIKAEVKDEPTNDNNGATTSSGNMQQPTQRPCCQYGIRCYRRNPLHRSDEAHPGDVDYTLPDYPDPPLGAPACPFLDRCYRRNPVHFQQFSHKTTVPPKGKKGYEATAKLPQAPNQTTTNTTTNTDTNRNASDSESEADPYATDDDQDDDYQGDGTSGSEDNA